MDSSKIIIALAGLSGFLAVGLGAFGAHGLANILSAKQKVTYNLAVEYQFYHTLALLLVAVLLAQANLNERYLLWAAWCFGLGIMVFSGSLYVLAITGVTWLGAITPIGGVAFIAGWVLLMLSGLMA